MKSLLALALFSSVAVAADNRAIYDLQYLPNAGTTYGFSDLAITDISSKTPGPDRSEDNGWTFSQTVGHAFTDRFSIEGALNYTDIKSEIDNGTDSEETKTSGISDPTIAAKFRVMDENFRFDVIGGAIIGLGDSEVKSDGDENNLQGGHSVFAAAQIGMKKDYSQWSLFAQWIYDFESTTDDKSANDEIKDEAHSTLALQADLLTKLYEHGFIRSFVGASFTNKFERDSDNDGERDVESDTLYTLGAEFRHLLSQDLMLKAGIANVQNRDANVGVNYYTYTVGANYQF